MRATRLAHVFRPSATTTMALLFNTLFMISTANGDALTFIALKGDDQFPVNFSSLGRQTSASRVTFNARVYGQIWIETNINWRNEKCWTYPVDETLVCWDRTGRTVGCFIGAFYWENENEREIWVMRVELHEELRRVELMWKCIEIFCSKYHRICYSSYFLHYT